MLVRLVTERVPFSSGRCQPQPKSHRGRAQSDRIPIGGENLMEINVVGRHMDVPDRFRRHLTDKLDKVTQFAPAAMRVDVEISQEKNPRRAELSDRVELTVHDDGSVIRSEARADDLYGALDIAYGKLLERLQIGRASCRASGGRRGAAGARSSRSGGGSRETTGR